MIIGLALIFGGFAWLAWETKFLTLRLPRHTRYVVLVPELWADTMQLVPLVFAATIVFGAIRWMAQGTKAEKELLRK